MTEYTKSCIIKVVEFADNQQREYMANKMPNTLLKAPVYHYDLEYNSELEIDILVNELTGWGLIITVNHIINDEENKYDLKLDCTKYFYDKSDRQANYGQNLPYPNYIRHFDNYDNENYHYNPQVEAISNPQTPTINDTLQYEIIQMSTDNLIIQIKKEILYQKSITEGLQELTYDNTITGRSYDYNRIYEYLNSFAYSISININDSDPLNQTTQIKFNYMSK